MLFDGSVGSFERHLGELALDVGRLELGFAYKAVPVELEALNLCVIIQNNRECPFRHVGLLPNNS